MKFLKLKLHHLSYYHISLYDDNRINIQFVMYNYNDTSDNKKFKVTTTSQITLSPERIIHTHAFTTNTRSVANHSQEPCNQECYEEIHRKLTDNIDNVLRINKELKSLKGLKGSFEAKQRLKREKKQLENARSVFKGNLKTLLKELFEKPPVVLVNA